MMGRGVGMWGHYEFSFLLRSICWQVKCLRHIAYSPFCWWSPQFSEIGGEGAKKSVVKYWLGLAVLSQNFCLTGYRNETQIHPKYHIKISVCTGSQYPHSIRTVTAQYPHSIRTVSACENRGISANPRLYKRSSELRILLSTHAFAEIPLFSHADTVRILCGYCADTVRILWPYREE